VTLTERVHLENPTHDDRQRALSGLILRIGITDVLVIIWAVMGARLIRFGPEVTQAKVPPEGLTSFELGSTIFSVFLIVAWLIILRVHGAYDHRLLGSGSEEYRAVARASFWLFAVVAVVSYVLRLDVARGYVAMALPAGMIGLLVSRVLWRRWLNLHRAQGMLSASVLVVGDQEHLVGLIRALNSVPEAGYHVVAACCGDADRSSFGPIPVLGDELQAAQVAREIGVTTVACTSSSRFGADGLRHLGWALEGQDVDLVVAPGLTDVAGPRVLTRPVAGLSLLHVEEPVFAGVRLAVKTVFDRCVAILLMILLSPLFVTVVVLIKADRKGPVFYRQERVGKDGTFFPMFKFRTMLVGAEAMLPSLKDRSDGNGHLFKLHEDPRITPIGVKLRRYSLDELPQLMNVLRGEMSLVGPRPPLPSEVEKYSHDVRRRLLVRPGMTGLWQINGRSDLSWDESVRFDLYYVENWSVVSDLTILWRTGRAVLRATGAY